MSSSLTKEEQRSCFVESFFEELDSTYGSGLICCCSCVDNFKEIFPSISEGDNYQFQCNQMEPHWFWESSRISGWIDKDIFDEEYAKLECPNCRKTLANSLICHYSYTCDFTPNLKKNINEISYIAKHTPFLLLNHPFSRLVENSIKELAGSKESGDITVSLFRGRKQDQVMEKEKQEEFLIPPKEVVTEGRFNHNGNPVLYLSNSIQTAFEECRRENVFVAELVLYVPIKILDIRPGNDFILDTELNAFLFSTAVSSEQNSEGWAKPEYVFTRFIADCARYHGFDAIKYSSTRIRYKTWNLVLLNDFSNQLEIQNIVSKSDKKNKT